MERTEDIMKDVDSCLKAHIEATKQLTEAFSCVATTRRNLDYQLDKIRKELNKRVQETNSAEG